MLAGVHSAIHYFGTWTKRIGTKRIGDKRIGTKRIGGHNVSSTKRIDGQNVSADKTYRRTKRIGRS
jgi:hypothetical protein